ncbi:peptidase M50 [Mycolicibacillus trivialis]|uniref:Peptidase M50 n=1 Tax=Mycolicibacillus trivialis TaxID=1798 RepID=A0A1X2EN54_9MYCO|nr:peptidase M50 [Mycolicibacillus trivialis]
MNTAETQVLLFDGAAAPAPLAGLPATRIGAPEEVDAVLDGPGRLVVVGTDAALATVLSRLLRADRLDIEVAHVTSRRGARRALSGRAREVPLIRDETGTVLVGSATWRGADGELYGEAVVDDTVLFDGRVRGVRVEPLPELPGLRARVTGRLRRRWVVGRAAQLGSTGALVVRDGVPAPRRVRRFAFYRHIRGWRQVR